MRFTLNNWTEEAKHAILNAPKFSYVIVGEELAPSTGTRHLQGYAEFKSVYKFGPFAKKYKIHFETCEATAEANINYCKKDGVFEERGTPKQDPALAGKKGGEIEQERWKRNIELAEQGKLDELKQVDPQAYTRCFFTYKRMKQDAMPALPELDQLQNYWIWGPPGIGKSRKARDMCDGHPYYPKPCNKWWDGYQNEEVVIIDDIEKENHLDHYLKIWADHYDFIAECKGGSIRIRPMSIIITSNYSPEECFTESTLLAIRRRFKVIHMTSL